MARVSSVRNMHDDRKPELRSLALVRALEEAHSGPAWHGPSLRTTLRRCTVE